ncbi:MAG: CsbD family protein [Planctomycetaceae bacterium]|nr:CsbD family protein [Planctomycetaceae bacterium]
MNSDRIEGNWKQLSGSLKEKWGKLTDDDLTQVDGKREKLLGKLQERYGLARDKAEQELRQFEQMSARK